MDNKKRSTDQLHLINICVTLLLLVGVGILTLVLPKPTVSEIEKRELAEKPELTLQSWFSGQFSKAFDAYYADTFPQREQLVSVASRLESVRGYHPDDVRIHQGNTSQQTTSAQPVTPDPTPTTPEQETTPSTSNEQTQTPSIDYEAYEDPNAPGNGLTGEGTGGEQAGNLFLYRNMGMQIFGASEKMSKRYAQVISSYAEDLDGVQVYSLIAPTSIEFYLPEKYEGIASSEKENIEFVNSQFSEKVQPVDAYSEIEKQKEDYLYFRTDHHWTVRGAYAAYIAFCKTAGLEPVALDEMERHQIDGFVGTFYNQTQDAQLAATPDFVEYFVPPTETTTWRYLKGAPYTPVESTIFASYATGGQNTYSVFLHGDFPLTHIQTDNHTGRKIMLVKESYGNAFAPFLVSHYDDVYIVDQRYFELGVEDFIKENGITDLLFLNNIFAVNTGVRIDELESIKNQTYTPYVPPVQTEQPAQQPEETQPIEQQPEQQQTVPQPVEEPSSAEEEEETPQTEPPEKHTGLKRS